MNRELDGDAVRYLGKLTVYPLFKKYSRYKYSRLVNKLANVDTVYTYPSLPVVGFHDPRPGVLISLSEGVKLLVGLISAGDVQYFELSLSTVRKSLTSNELVRDDV